MDYAEQRRAGEDRLIALGHRVRVILEWYSPDWDRDEAESWLTGVELRLDDMLPGSIAAVYVEANPPAEEL